MTMAIGGIIYFYYSKTLFELVFLCSGYLPADFPNLATLVEDADTKLFNSIRHNSTHVLRHYLIDKPVPVRSLRARAHNFVLPPKDNRNFVSRALYDVLCPSNC